MRTFLRSQNRITTSDPSTWIKYFSWAHTNFLLRNSEFPISSSQLSLLAYAHSICESGGPEEKNLPSPPSSAQDVFQIPVVLLPVRFLELLSSDSSAGSMRMMAQGATKPNESQVASGLGENHATQGLLFRSSKER